MRVLCVAEKPSIAKAVTGILSGGQYQTVRRRGGDLELTRQHNGQHKYCKNYSFGYRLPPAPQHHDFVVTSVLGHLTCSDFDEQLKSWRSCDPSQLFDAEIHHFVNPVRELSCGWTRLCTPVLCAGHA